MPGWRISPDGVAAVLSAVATVANTLSDSLDKLPPDAEAAAAGTGPSPIIADALNGFFEHHRPTLETIGTRITNAVGGASAATQAYIDGDLDMAAQHLSGAATAAGTEIWTPGTP